jgi:NodT family efflux transporter outer membrane factor (OMF) lipoprotein
MRRILLTLASASILTSCAHGDRMDLFSEVPASDILSTAPVAWKAAYKTNGQTRSSNWVASFHDAQMSQLVGEALAHNHNLEASAARVEQAIALAKISRSARLPVVSLGANGTGTFPSGAPDTDTYGGNVSASWELDIWGKIRDRANASKQDAAATEAGYEALRLSIAGQTASSWIDLVAAAQQEALALDTVETRKRSLGIVERRYRRGLSSSLDIRLSRSALAGSQATLAFQKQLHANATRRLEVLLGRYPAEEIKAAEALPKLDALSLSGAPADLLYNRPDIRASEARMTAAGLRVSEARKAMLPSLSLSGSASTGGGNIGDILDFDSVLGRLIGSVSQPVFRGGAIRADIARNEAAHREQLANYAQTVLNAWREAEDALSGEKYLAERETALRVSAEEAIEAERLAEREYGRGVGTIFELLDAQRRRISTEGQLITASSARSSNRISLYLALGGDQQLQAAQIAQSNDEEPKA